MSEESQNKSLEQEGAQQEPTKTANDTYVCPSCGAPMSFDPATSKLRCTYCDTVIDINGEASDEELSFDDLDEKEDISWKDAMTIFRCPNCGAENVAPKTSLSMVCPFCGSNQVIDNTSIVGMKPNRIVPFRIDSDKAVANYQTWLKKKLLAPHKIKVNIPKLVKAGVYIPCWTYDTSSFSTYQGRLGEHYTVTVGTGKDRHTETRTRYFYVSGTKQVVFDDVLVEASKKIAQKDLNSVAPYRTNEAVVYDERYMAGFQSEHYSTTCKEGWTTAKQLMSPVIKNKILSDYRYDVVDYLNVKTQYANITYKYVLLPMWIGNYQWNSKTYSFIVNGESGRMTGSYPKSWLKITILVVLGLLIVSLLLYFILFYGE